MSILKRDNNESNLSLNSNSTLTTPLYQHNLHQDLIGFKPGQYTISSVLVDPKAAPSLLPSLTSFSTNAYVPSSLSSLGTTFTPSALPTASSSSSSHHTSSSSSNIGGGGGSVAQRRSQAPIIIVNELRKVDKKEFEGYLESVGKEWERWEKEKKLGKEGRADLGNFGGSGSGSGRKNGKENRRNGIRGGGMGLGIGGSSSYNGRNQQEAEEDEEEEDFYKRGTSRREEILPPLEGVPKIFFDSEFNLANPRTFDLVTERLKLDSVTGEDLIRREEEEDDDERRGGGGEGMDLATDQILQEKLSHYTAVVESHLVREIGLKSSSFFSALSNLQSLHSQGEDCLAKIVELQSALSAGSSTSSTTTSTTSISQETQVGIGGSAQRGIEILRFQARRRGLEKLEEGIRSIEEIYNALEGIKDLLEQGEWMLALEVGESVEERYYGLEMEEMEEEDGDKLESSSSSSTSKLGDVKEEEEEDEEEEDETFGTQLSTSSSTTLPPPVPSKSSKPSSSTSLRKVPKLNLTKIKALDSVPSKLDYLRNQVAKALESELVGVLDHELELGMSEFGKGGKGKGKEILPVAISGEEEEVTRSRLRERVRPVVKNLGRANGLEGAIAAWRESMLKEVRSMVREHLPTSETPTMEEEDTFAQTSKTSIVDVSEKSLSLARNLRALSHVEFLLLAETTYTTLIGCIELVELHAQVLIELMGEVREDERLRKSRRRNGTHTMTTSTTTSPNLSLLGLSGSSTTSRPSLSLSIDSTQINEDELSLSSDISDIVHATAELANLRFSKVIGVRTEIHSTLSLEEFVEIFDISWSFVLRCEVICQRMIVGLRGVMVGQAKTFLQTYHQKRISEMAKLVENEQWGAAEVTPLIQNVVNLVLQSAVGDPNEFLIGKRKRKEIGNSVVKVEEVVVNTKQLDIEGREYFAVSAGLASLEILADYLKVVMNCPLLTTDAVSKVVEYMKSFNSRTCQVVLGAGAMRSAGLKNITAKHLALASQALSIMISLIPYIRETLRRHLNPKQAVMLTEFDKLKRDYQEHQNEIHAKLVAIMGDRLMLHCKTLESIDWELPIPGRKEGQPNIYMEALVKEHTTLHKVLSRFLQGPTVEFIMMQVFSALNAGLAEQFGSLEVKTEAAKSRMMVDVTYLKNKLAELKGMERDTPGAELENLISMKSLPEPPRPAPPLRASSFTTPFATTPSPIPSPNLNTTSNTPLFDSNERPSSPLPPLPFEAIIPESTPASIEIVAPIPIQAKPVVPAPRKSMAERLAEVARRGSSGDFPSRTPSPSATTISSTTTTTTPTKLNEVEVNSSELPSVPNKEKEVEVAEIKKVEVVPEVKVLEKEVHDEPEQVESLDSSESKGAEEVVKESKVESISTIGLPPSISISAPEEVSSGEVVEKEKEEEKKEEEVVEERETIEETEIEPEEPEVEEGTFI